MTRHELGKLLLEGEDGPLLEDRCRWCGKTVKREDRIGTGAMRIGEGCYDFHRGCLEAMPKEVRAEANLVWSSYFVNEPQVVTLRL